MSKPILSSNFNKLNNCDKNKDLISIIIINIRGQIENRLLENSCCAGRKWLQAGCKCIYGPAADWFLDHHQMDFNKSGDFVDAGKPFTYCTHAVRFEDAVYC